MYDQGYQHLTDDEIVEVVLNEESQELELEVDDVMSTSANDHDAHIISHSTAVEQFRQCLSWLQHQEEATADSLNALRSLHDLAVSKRFNEVCKS